MNVLFKDFIRELSNVDTPIKVAPVVRTGRRRE